MPRSCGNNHDSYVERFFLAFDLHHICILKSFSQLMVGSRYHELIESADSIVSMKETSTEVLGLLRNFPYACSNVLQQVKWKEGKRV